MNRTPTHKCLTEHYCKAIESRHFETKVLQTISVVSFPGARQEGNIECFSVGMCDLPQFAKTNALRNRIVSTELYCSIHDVYMSQALELMEAISNYPRWTRTHLHWGHSVSLANTILGCAVRGVLLTMPPFRAEMMSVNCGAGRVDLLFVVPLIGNEFGLLRKIGMEKFEERLERAAVDVTDLNREPLD
jgi:hypothetical protein